MTLRRSFSTAKRIASAATSGWKMVPVGRALRGILFFVQMNCVVFSAGMLTTEMRTSLF